MARSIKDKVEAILEYNEDARNSHKILIKKYWKAFDSANVSTNEAGDWVLLDRIILMTSPETIRRTCQLLQNKEGKYPPTDPVVLERRKREKGVRFTINGDNPERYLPD